MTYHWAGTLNLEGGKGGVVEGAAHNSGGSGEKGTALHSKCHGGYSGPFC